MARERHLGRGPWLVIVVCALLGLTGPATASASDRPCAGSAKVASTTTAKASEARREARRIRGAIRCLVAAERRSRGLRDLTDRSALREAAERHARDMVARHYFSHVSPGGSRVQDRVRRTGYLRGVRRWDVGEALGWGADVDSSPRALVEALLDSRAHRALLLDGGFRDIGIGVVLGVPDRENDDAPGVTVALTFGAVER